MLATLVIGLREGLEAALIVGIIAAFLRQNGRADALRRMWLGVAIAVVLCLGVGIALQAFNSSLPQRQQEMLECVVAAIAVVMVSYMVLWMRGHSRSLRADLHSAAGGALASGSATALVVMAFLAVFREGFETAVFLLAAFQSAVSPAQAVTGAVLGIVVAVALGFLIYRGGVKLNLSRFFRITGVVLVLVAAGLVMSTLRAAHEAGWLVVGQQHAVSLDVIARPGTVAESLLTGVLGIRSWMPIVEVVAYLLYLVPMSAVVLWPARSSMTGRRLSRTLAGTAAAALVLAVGLISFSPSGPTMPAAVRLQMTVATQGSISSFSSPAGSDREQATVTGVDRSTVSLDGFVRGSSTLTLSGHGTVAGVAAAVYTGAAVTVDAVQAGLPTRLTTREIAAIGGGRLPIGLSPGGPTRSLPTVYSDTWTPTVTVDPASGTVLGLSLAGVRTATVSDSTGRAFRAGVVATVDAATTSTSSQQQAVVAADVSDQRADHEVWGEVLPGLLVVSAVVLLAFVAAQSVRRRSANRAGQAAVHLSAGPPEPQQDAIDGGHEALDPVASHRRR